MKSTRLNLSRVEVNAILPGLNLIVERVAAMRGANFSGVIPAIDAGKKIFVARRYDRKMYEQLLSVWKRLKSIPPSRKVRFNALELSAAALGLRVTRRERLRENTPIPACVAGLEEKLEKYRKRAKRSEVGEYGVEHYVEIANNWRRFVQWLRHDILYRAKRVSRAVAMKRKQNRARIRSLALEVMTETTDKKTIFHLADLARRELRRGRHEFSLKEILKDDDEARRFVAKFIMKRVRLEMVRLEYVPQILRNSVVNSDVFDNAKVIGAGQSGCENASGSSPAAISGLLQESVKALGDKPTRAAKSADIEIGSGMESSRVELTTEQVADRLSDWLVKHTNPQYWDKLREEIEYQLSTYEAEHRRWARSHAAKEAFEEASRPLDSGNILDFAIDCDWAARSLCLLSSNSSVSWNAIKMGFKMARDKDRRLTFQTRLRALSQR